MGYKIEDKEKLHYIDTYLGYFDFEVEYESEKGKVRTWIEREKRLIDGIGHPANIKILSVQDKNFSFRLYRNIYEIISNRKINNAEFYFISNKGPNEDRIFMRLCEDWDKLIEFLERIKKKYLIIKEEDEEYRRMKVEEEERLRKIREEEGRKEIDRLIASII